MCGRPGVPASCLFCRMQSSASIVIAHQPSCLKRRWGMAHVRPTSTCKTCNVRFKYKPSDSLGIYCSRKCMLSDPSWRDKVRLAVSESNKIRTSHKGWKMSLESRHKMSTARKGKPLSLQCIEQRRGRTPWNKGKARPDMTGPLHPLWRGGITSLSKMIRECPAYHEWRAAVQRRDHYTCQMCKSKRPKIHVDHIKPFAQLLKENRITTLHDAVVCSAMWDINNGRVLCKDCHQKERHGTTSKIRRVCDSEERREHAA